MKIELVDKKPITNKDFSGTSYLIKINNTKVRVNIETSLESDIAYELAWAYAHSRHQLGTDTLVRRFDILVAALASRITLILEKAKLAKR